MSENYELDIGRANGNSHEAHNHFNGDGGHRGGKGQGSGWTNSDHHQSSGWTRGHGPRGQDRRGARPDPAQLPYTESILNDPEYKLPFDPWRLFDALNRRWYYLIGGAALLGAGAFFLAMILVDYSVSVKLIRREMPNAFRTGDSASTYQPHEFSEITLMSLMRTPELLDRVSTSMKPPVPVSKLLKSTKVSPTQDPDTVILTVKGKDDLNGMVELVNNYAEEIIRFTRQMQSTESGEVSVVLSNKLAAIDMEIDTVNKQLLRISPNAGLGSFEKETEAYLGELAKIDLKLQAAKANYEVVDARISVLTNSLAKQTPQNEELAVARQELAKLRRELTDLHPSVITKIEQIKRLEGLPPSSVTNSVALSSVALSQLHELERERLGLQKEIESYQEIFDKQKLERGSMSQKAMDFAGVQSKLDSLKLKRKLLETQWQESQIFMGSAMGYYKALSRATIKDVHVQNRWMKVGLLGMMGALFGFLASASLIMIVEAMDARLKTASDVERTTQLPLLATLGDLRKMDPAEQVNWAFRTLTILKGKLSGSSNQALVCGFISSGHGEGRSTWINLLVSAASQRGLRVLTVDTRPTATKPEVSKPSKKEKARDKDRSEPVKEREEPNENTSTDVLASPLDVTQQLTGPDSQPIVHIPLPGWVWNLERRNQWQKAMAHWKQIDNLVLLVELPPASQQESILLAEKLPQIIWLTGSGKADARETIQQLETLRHAHCNVVGAVLNQEPSTFVKRHFSRWFYRAAAVALTMSATLLYAADETNVSFSVSTPIKRAAWQQRLTLGPGDGLDFTLFGHPELSRTNIVVGPDGRLTYLQATDIPVVGLTIEELRAKMDEELAKYYIAPRTIVTPVAFNSKKYFVLGKVVTKGVFTLDRPLTIIEAVARARGLETGLYERNTVEMADLGHSVLVRDGKKMNVDFEKLFYEGDLSQNIPLEPNDYLYFAGMAVNEIYMLGEVMNPGPLGFTPRATMIAALTDRGGFTSRAYKKKVLVIRGSLNQPETFVVDTSAILEAREPDFKLQPKDIIYVSARPWIKVEELLDAAADAFIQGAITTWTGGNIGPLITRPLLPQL